MPTSASTESSSSAAQPTKSLRRRPPRRRRPPKAPQGASLTAPADASPVITAPMHPVHNDVPAPRRLHVRRRHRDPSENIFEAIERCQPRAAAVRDDGLPADIAPHLLDQDGLRILDRLHQSGFEAYFVGGCVRDLLIGQKPKDFDISTSARPEEIRGLFGNCRLIGRRFRLAHVFFRDGKIIEVSTFRAKPTQAEFDGVASPNAEDLLIVRDNVFGTSEEDALRRDLTINGLFYDVERGRVLDFVGSGLSDLEARLIRSIGDPEIRLREDPVRILRAVRFSVRLGFQIEAGTWDAMKGAVCELPRCSAPRLLEETFKFLRSGVAHDAFRALHELGALDYLLFPIGRWLKAADEAARARFFAELKSLDGCVRQAPLDDALLLAAILSPLIDVTVDGHHRLSQEAEAFLDALAQRARLPRRISDRVRKLFWAEAVLTGRLRRKRSLRSFREHPEFKPGLKLLELHANSSAELREIFEIWNSGSVPGQVQPSRSAPKARRRRRGRSRRGECPSAEQPADAQAVLSQEVPLAQEAPDTRARAAMAQDKGQMSFGFKT